MRIEILRAQLSRCLVFIACLTFLQGCADSDVQSQVADLELETESLPASIENKNIFSNYGGPSFCSNVKFASDDFDHYKNAYSEEYYAIGQKAFVYSWTASMGEREYGVYRYSPCSSKRYQWTAERT